MARARVWGFTLALAATVAMGLAHTDARTGGAGPQAAAGCGGLGCHGVGPSDSARAELGGLPEAYTPGETYLLNVSVTGAPEPLPPALAAGGFALHATDGALAPPPGSDTVQVGEDGNATHRPAGATRRDWSVVWIAPPPTAGTVTFTLSALAANGNGVPDPLDAWAQRRLEVKEGPAPAPPPPPSPDDTPPVAQGDSQTPGPAAFAALTAGALAASLRRRARIPRRSR